MKCAMLVIVPSNRLQLSKHGDMYLLITMHERELQQTVPSEMTAAASDQQYSPSGLSDAPSASCLSAPPTQPIPPRLTVVNSQESVPPRLSVGKHQLSCSSWRQPCPSGLSAATHTHPHPSGMSSAPSQQPQPSGLSAAPPNSPAIRAVCSRVRHSIPCVVWVRWWRPAWWDTPGSRTTQKADANTFDMPKLAW